MAKKEKPKKEKKKKQKNDQAEGEKKGGKKKLLLLVPVLAGVGAGVYFFVLNGGGLPFLGGGKDKTIDVYAVEDEMVASVTAALEECGEQTLMSITTNVAPPDAEPAEGEEGAEGEEEEKKDEEKEEENKDEEKDDKKKDKDAPNRGEAQYIDEGEGGDGTRWTYYYYKIGETTVADLNAYTEFLNEEGFELVSGGGTDEETSALGIYQKEAETEEDHIFSIEMEYPLAGDATGRGESSGSSGANEPAGPAKPAEAGKSDESGEADGPRRRSSASSRARVAASSSRTVFTTFSCPRNRQRNMKARPANSTMTNANSMFFPFRFGALSRRVNPRRRPHKAARPILSRTGRPRPGAYRFPP